MTAGTTVQLLAGSAVLAGLVGLAPHAREQPSPGCDAASYRQFDFWQGEWEVFDAREALVGRNRIQTVLNGCAMTEDWQGASGGRGTSLTAYTAADDRWHQMWVDGRGGRLALDGTWDASTRTMTLSGCDAGRDGAVVRHEISWRRLDDGSVRQVWRSSRDNGTTWQEVFDGRYRRVAGG